jgi:hypothetical protein
MAGMRAAGVPEAVPAVKPAVVTTGTCVVNRQSFAANDAVGADNGDSPLIFVRALVDNTYARLRTSSSRVTTTKTTTATGRAPTRRRSSALSLTACSTPHHTAVVQWRSFFDGDLVFIHAPTMVVNCST